MCRDACRDYKIRDGGENVPSNSGACATHNFTDLARGLWLNLPKIKSSDWGSLWGSRGSQATQLHQSNNTLGNFIWEELRLRLRKMTVQSTKHKNAIS